MCDQCEIEKERADYAWRNTLILEAARQEEMKKRDIAEAKLKEALAIIEALKV